MTNWKTTVAGIFILLGIFGKDMQAGKIDPMTDLTAASAAVGLIVAKDHNARF